MSDDIIPENDQTHARREHLDKIRELIGNAYPNKFRRTNVAGSAEGVDDFDSGWQLLPYLDHGDFLGVEGEMFVTKTGELSVHVREMRFLSRALVPMPDKLHASALTV